MSKDTLQLNEIVRKAIHLFSSIIPILYWLYFDRVIMLNVMIIIALGFLLAEYLRMHSHYVQELFIKIFGSALRNHEFSGITGATYVFTGAVVTIFLFPREIAIPALLVLSVADTGAALIGIPFGKHPFFNKSVEGSLTFFILSFLILFMFSSQNIFWQLGIAASVAVIEALPLTVDDNFVIPLSTGLLLILPTLF